MKRTEINKWWRQALRKEEIRQTNHPKSPTGSWVVPTNFSNFAPQERNARRRRSA